MTFIHNAGGANILLPVSPTTHRRGDHIIALVFASFCGIMLLIIGGLWWKLRQPIPQPQVTVTTTVTNVSHIVYNYVIGEYVYLAIIFTILALALCFILYLFRRTRK